MDWTPGGLSGDVEDRRGSSGGGGGFGFGGGGGLGIVGLLVLVVISLLTGRNYIGSYLSGHAGAPPQATNQYNRPATSASPQEERSAQLVSFVLDDVQKTWTTLLPEQTRRPYRRAKLVLFRRYTQSGCGVAQSQTGPFYCPEDEKVYIDLSFWDQLRRIGGSSADFAQAYVVAHELGHHVQDILGIEQQVRQLWGRIRRNGIGSRWILSCRLTASRGCGRIALRSEGSSSRQIFQPDCRRLRLWGMIICRRWSGER